MNSFDPVWSVLARLWGYVNWGYNYRLTSANTENRKIHKKDRVCVDLMKLFPFVFINYSCPFLFLETDSNQIMVNLNESNQINSEAYSQTGPSTCGIAKSKSKGKCEIFWCKKRWNRFPNRLNMDSLSKNEKYPFIYVFFLFMILLMKNFVFSGFFIFRIRWNYIPSSIWWDQRRRYLIFSVQLIKRSFQLIDKSNEDM